MKKTLTTIVTTTLAALTALSAMSLTTYAAEKQEDAQTEKEKGSFTYEEALAGAEEGMSDYDAAAADFFYDAWAAQRGLFLAAGGDLFYE